MTTARECALYFMKNGFDAPPNTFDGNMKLQKLLVFANLISLSEYNTPLFDDEILAFKNGCVVENIRLEYRNDFPRMRKESDAFTPNFSREEQEVLDLTIGIFGGFSARKLSELNHQFAFWKRAYDRGTSDTGYHDKNISQVKVIDMKDETEKMGQVILAYKNLSSTQKCELINGVKFFYEPHEIELTDSIIDELEEISLQADESAYTIYRDNGKLVIY